MKVKFWGVRGSIPRCHPDMIKYGGNTPCIEVTSSSGHTFILDMGSGAVDLGGDLLKRMQKIKQGTVLITHTHWDHIQGFPFFAPFFVPGFKWEVYGPKGLSGSFEDTLAGQMQTEYFPVTLSQLMAEVNCHDLYECMFKTKGVTIRTQYLNHTVLTLGYRLESGGVSIAYVTDHEPYDHRLAVEGYKRSSDDSLKTDDDRHVEFFEGVDLLIHDCQYTAEEYGNGKTGWGHSTIDYVVDVAVAAGVKRLALFHHDPNRTDDQVDALVKVATSRAEQKAKEGNLTAPEIFAAAERMSIDFSEKRLENGRRPSALAGSIQVPNGVVFAVDNVVACLDSSMTFEKSLKEELDKDNLSVHLCKNFESFRRVTEEKRPAVAILNQTNPGGTESALDVCREIKQKMIGQGVDITFFIIAKTQKDLEKGRASSIVPVDNWISEPLSVDYIRTRIRMSILRSKYLYEEAPIPINETERLHALHESCLLGVSRPESVSRLGRIAIKLFSVPIVAFSLLDEDQIKFIAVESTDDLHTPTAIPRDAGLCCHIVSTTDLLVVNDASKDERFCRSPHVAGEPFIRFYAGLPITLQGSDGIDYVIGAMSLIDLSPRKLNMNQIKQFKDLASLVNTEFTTLSQNARSSRN